MSSRIRTLCSWQFFNGFSSLHRAPAGLEIPNRRFMAFAAQILIWSIPSGGVFPRQPARISPRIIGASEVSYSSWGRYSRRFLARTHSRSHTGRLNRGASNAGYSTQRTRIRMPSHWPAELRNCTPKEYAMATLRFWNVPIGCSIHCRRPWMNWGSRT